MKLDENVIDIVLTENIGYNKFTLEEFNEVSIILKEGYEIIINKDTAMEKESGILLKYLYLNSIKDIRSSAIILTVMGDTIIEDEFLVDVHFNDGSETQITSITCLNDDEYVTTLTNIDIDNLRKFAINTIKNL